MSRWIAGFLPGLMVGGVLVGGGGSLLVFASDSGLSLSDTVRQENSRLAVSQVFLTHERDQLRRDLDLTAWERDFFRFQLGEYRRRSVPVVPATGPDVDPSDLIPPQNLPIPARPGEMVAPQEGAK